MSHYQLFQNGLKVAEVSGPKAYTEALHYAWNYAEDSDISIKAMDDESVAEMSDSLSKLQIEGQFKRVAK